MTNIYKLLKLVNLNYTTHQKFLPVNLTMPVELYTLIIMEFPDFL